MATSFTALWIICLMLVPLVQCDAESERQKRDAPEAESELLSRQQRVDLSRQKRDETEGEVNLSRQKRTDADSEVNLSRQKRTDADSEVNLSRQKRYEDKITLEELKRVRRGLEEEFLLRQKRGGNSDEAELSRQKRL